MGLRHARHRFMPNVLVFPGGRVDRADHCAKAVSELPAFTRACLERQAPPSLARALGIAAARELEEETGYRPERMVSLGWVHPNPAWQNNRQHLFLAHGCVQIHQGKLDEGEDIRVERVERDGLSERVISGEITHESVLALLYRESLQRRES